MLAHDAVEQAMLAHDAVGEQAMLAHDAVGEQAMLAHDAVEQAMLAHDAVEQAMLAHDAEGVFQRGDGQGCPEMMDVDAH